MSEIQPNNSADSPRVPSPPPNSPRLGQLSTGPIAPKVLKRALESFTQNSSTDKDQGHSSASSSIYYPKSGRQLAQEANEMNPSYSKSPGCSQGISFSHPERSDQQIVQRYQNSSSVLDTQNQQIGYVSRNNRSSYQNNQSYQEIHGRQSTRGQPSSLMQKTHFVPNSGNLSRHSFDSQNSFSLHLNLGPQHGHSLQPDVERDHAKLQEQLYNMAQTISRQKGIPPAVVASLTAELHDLSQKYLKRSEKLHSDYGALQQQRDKLLGGIQEKKRALQSTKLERDQACIERDAFQTHFNRLSSQQQQLEQKISAIEKNYVASIDSLRKEVQFKDEQINGKRSLWLMNHPSSSMKRAPAGSTTPSGKSLGLGSESASPNQYQDPWEKTRISSENSKSSKLSAQIPTRALREQWGQYRCRSTVTDSNPNQNAWDSSGEAELTTLTRFKTDDEIADQFKGEFEVTYRLAEKWASTYANVVNDIAIDQLISEDATLWKFMLNCTFSNPVQAQAHVITLIRSTKTRRWFVMRMIVQYLHNHVWIATLFQGFNRELGLKLKHAQHQLTVGKSTPEERAALIGTQTDIVQHILKQEKYLSFRSKCIGDHMHALRAMLGPILNADAQRSLAGKDLGPMVASAFDIAVKMFTSNKTFVVAFPECGGRFQHTLMVCKDQSVTETPLSIHIRGERVLLIVTPVITMRDDRGMLIQVKNVMLAQVLIGE